MKVRMPALLASALLFVAIGCSNKNETIANQKQIEDQLQMAGLNNVTIHLDKDKRTAILDGSVTSDQEKATAERIVKATAPKFEMTDNITVQEANATSTPAPDEKGSQKAEPPKGKTAKSKKKAASQTASE